MKKIFFPVLFLVLSANFVAFAQDDGKFGFTPLSGQPKVIEAAPGSEVEFLYTLSNLNDTLKGSYMVEVNESSLKEGDSPLPPEWVKIVPSDNIELGAKEQAPVSIKIRVPEEAVDGSYRIAVRAKHVPGHDDESGSVKLSAAVGEKLTVKVSKASNVIDGPLLEQGEDAEPGTNNYMYVFYLVLAVVLLLGGRILFSGKK